MNCKPRPVVGWLVLVEVATAGKKVRSHGTYGFMEVSSLFYY